ncbi:hypothetical protein L6164_010319 [Bauhinia variegata]|uniref:Uncharacterized protein n=1 Tax=Bauhinia variegata TaxID=167791 RepID=A0ACB9PNZ1_BAUVA|nr:hypothetical protein L6164_010319 [Bauhinia variegata]
MVLTSSHSMANTGLKRGWHHHSNHGTYPVMVSLEVGLQWGKPEEYALIKNQERSKSRKIVTDSTHDCRFLHPNKLLKDNRCLLKCISSINNLSNLLWFSYEGPDIFHWTRIMFKGDQKQVRCWSGVIFQIIIKSNGHQIAEEAALSGKKLV